jgi:DivIVA domain-containing protein
MNQGLLTPGDVRGVVFDKAPIGKRGYDEEQVDAFLDLVEAAVAGSGTLTPDEVRMVVFADAPLIKRGYNEDQVDDFLDVVVATLEHRERVLHTEPPTRPVYAEQTNPMVFAKPPSLVDEALDTEPHFPQPNGPLALPLPPAPPGTRGYRAGDVEKLARLLARALTEVNGPTSADIRTAPLHRTFFNGQGYRTDVIDTIINAWVEELRGREG